MKKTSFNLKSIVQKSARWLLTLITLLTLGVGQTWAATSTTVYYAVNTSYTVKCNVNRKGDGDDWKTYTMTKTANKYNDKYIYSCSFTDLYDGLGCLQFQLYDGNTWKSQVQPISSWTGASTYNGKLYVSSWIDYRYDHTISNGATIVWDNAGNTSWSNTYLYKEVNGGSGSNSSAFTRCGSTTQWYKTYASAETKIGKLQFRANTSNWNDGTHTTDLISAGNLSGVTLFTYTNTKDGYALNWQVTTNAKKATSGVKVYFDNTASNWGEIWMKYGTQWFNRHTGAAASEVPGTDALYVITIPNDCYYEKYVLADKYGYTNYHNITADNNISNRIAHQTSNIASEITYIPTTGTGASPKVWSFETISGGHSRTLTFGSHTNGQITVRYTDESGVEHTVSSADESTVTVAQTCKVIITAVPNSGYAPSTLTLGGASITSGAQQIIRADATIAATFIEEETHNVTVSYKYGSRALHDNQVFEVGVTTPASINAEVIDGFSFSSWSNLTNVTNNTGNLTTNPISINTKVSGSDGSMTCNYTPWTCSLDIVPSEGATGYSSRTAMSYDATKKAYYINRTTTSATERYRFFINSIEYSTSSNTELTIDETKVDANTNVTNYTSNKPSVYFNDGPSGSNITIWFDYENKKAWVEEQKYTVTISAGANGSVSPTSVTAGAVRASETITATADEHYHWESWTLPNSGVTIASGAGTRQITIKATASGKIVTANFAGDQYTITYKDQGNVTYSGDNEASLPKTHTYGTATALVNGTKTGYNFGGWYTDATCTTSAGSSIGAKAKTANFTLYAKWTAINYTTSDNIKNSDNTTAGQYNVDYDATSISYTTAPSKTGYNIVGFYEEDGFSNKIANSDRSLVSATTTYTSSGKWKYTSAPNLYVKWTAKQYSITLDKKEGSENGSAKVKYDATSLTNISAPARSGYHVEGYYGETGRTNKVADASGALQSGVSGYTTGNKWTKDAAGTVTLYTKWAANTYTIKFSANDEQYAGDPASGTTASIAATYGVSYSLTANGFSREGYTFAGWATTPTGAVAYTNGQSVNNLTDENKGTVTLYAKWTGTTYTVTFNARGGSGLTPTSKEVTMGATYGTLATVTPPAGYVFDGWYTSSAGGTKVTAETLVATPSDHTLYAHYAVKKQVYFKNTLGWDKVYVTYDSWWNSDGQGAGNEGKTYHKMKLVAGTTDVYYDDIPDAVLTSWKWNIAFDNQGFCASDKKDNPTTGTYHGFNSGEAVFRYDFDSIATMFVPTNNKKASEDGNFNDVNSTQYRSTGYTNDNTSDPNYTSGYWRTYNNTYSGYTMTYQKSTEGSTWHGGNKLIGVNGTTNTFIYTLTLDANSTYYFSMYKQHAVNNKTLQFGRNYTVKYNYCTDIKLESKASNLTLNTTAAGEYIFKLELKEDGHMYLSVEYPVRANDYRVVYTWNDGSDHTYNSEIIRAAAGTNETISVFVHKSENVSSQSLEIQKCASVSGSTVSWSPVNTITLPTASITENGVYDFIITQPASGDATGAYWNKYTGNYYIRTAASDGGWDMYKYRPDNIMTLSEYSLTQTLSEPYSHYYCRFIESTDMDITYAVATDYSPNISGILVGDATIGGVNKTKLPASANVRFTYNEKTNALFRAYLKNAQGAGNTRFLVLHGKDGKIFNANGTAIAADAGQSLAANELLFSDLGNWVYQVELQAQPKAAVSLIARYNGETAAADRYLIGSASEYQQIIGGDASTTKYDILAVYDFKTNRLMTVWVPGDGNITQSLQDVDVLLIRHGQEAGRTIVFGTGGALNTNKVIGAIEFRYNELVGHVANWNQASREKLMFDVSFPFDVNVSDIFGLNAAYGEAYAVQKYNGEERAAKGFFQGDGTTTFWQTLSPSDVMKANVGYTIITDNDYFNNDVGHLWDNKSAGSKIYLYFPSASNVGNITSETQKITVPKYECTIDRTFTGSNGRTMNHKYTDSNWNMMGVPVFANVTGNASGSDYDPGRVFLTSGAPGEENTFHYFYKWNTGTNGYDITAGNGYQFKSMHSYMVQYTGQVWFTGTAPAPVSAVAARSLKDENHYVINMQMLDEAEEVVTRTYVELRENACDTFALNEDVCMIPGEGDASIYSFAGNYDVAANVLPIANQVVVLGVEVNKAGKYTFSMPSIFSGKVTLIDNYTGEHVDLSMDDYEVELEKGIISDRFMLEINIEKVTTAIDGANDGATLKDGKAHKFLQNGILYILQNGILYDAQGKRVQ